MLPVIAWRPLVAAFTIVCFVVYTWLGNLVPNLEFSGHPISLQPIPKKIWQINFKHAPSSKLEPFIASWKNSDAEYQHTLLDEQAAKDVVDRHYGKDAEASKTYHELGSWILRSDYLRYLVLAAEGGIYSDIDTQVVKPIDEWYSASADRPVRALVGIEYDQLGDPSLTEGMYMPIQFCQWTLAISAHHPLMVSTVHSVTQAIQKLARSREVALSDLAPTTEEVLYTTGPVKWSQEVFAYLSSMTGTEVTHQHLTGLKEPKLFGDVLILPINAFASGLNHSGSKSKGSNETLVWHTFRNAWKVKGAKFASR
ncbi:MAG: hypothetical protein Q9216_006060 [Gyalolechia sp. 2 TL-2023]